MNKARDSHLKIIRTSVPRQLRRLLMLNSSFKSTFPFTKAQHTCTFWLISDTFFCSKNQFKSTLIYYYYLKKYRTGLERIMAIRLTVYRSTTINSLLHWTSVCLKEFHLLDASNLFTRFLPRHLKNPSSCAEQSSPLGNNANVYDFFKSCKKERETGIYGPNRESRGVAWFCLQWLYRIILLLTRYTKGRAILFDWDTKQLFRWNRRKKNLDWDIRWWSWWFLNFFNSWFEEVRAMIIFLGLWIIIFRSLWINYVNLGRITTILCSKPKITSLSPPPYWISMMKIIYESDEQLYFDTSIDIIFG